MLSAKTTSFDQVSTYHEQDNYYTRQIGEWWGKSRDLLNLSSNLTHESFINSLNGINPVTGEKLTASKSNINSERAAIDLTFTAPKSLSVALELAQAKKDNKLEKILLHAHDTAVNTALIHIETEYAKARVQKNKNRQIVNTSNLLVAKFQHETSRELDPTLHTHSVLINMTKCDDGKWRALEAKDILKNINLNGQYYRSELAKNLSEQGFEIDITNHKQAFFELSNVPKSLLYEFSKRRRQIEEKAKELKKKFPKMSKTHLYQKATLMSRKSKQNVDRNELKAENLARAEKLVNVDNLLAKFYNLKPIENNIDEKKIDQTLKRAKKIIRSWKKYQRTPEAILKLTSNWTLGTVRASDLWQKIKIKQTTKQEVKKSQELTMLKIVKQELKATKLNTQKLFASLEKTKTIDNHKSEEIYENARQHSPEASKRLTTSIDRTKHRNAETTEFDDRDAISIDREINATRDNKGDGRAELERDDSDSFRKSGSDEELSYEDAIKIANEEVKKINSQESKQEKSKGANNEQEQ